MLGPFDIATNIQSLLGQIFGRLGFMRTILTQLQATYARIQATYGVFIGYVNTALAQIASVLNKLRFMALIGFIITIGKCFFKGLRAIIDTAVWFGYFIVWIFYPWPPGVFDFKTEYDVTAGFIPWFIRFVICTSYKITSFPKCFLWYGLDIAGWIFYLPFRFLFWLVDAILDIGLVKLEHDTWCFLNDLDYFLHGPQNNYFMFQYTSEYPKTDAPDPESLNTGYHFIHFPDSVMEKCYALNYYGLANLPSFPFEKLAAFVKCALNPMDWDSSTKI
jgi:hypothetical protein